MGTQCKSFLEASLPFASTHCETQVHECKHGTMDVTHLTLINFPLFSREWICVGKSLGTVSVMEYSTLYLKKLIDFMTFSKGPSLI